MKPAKRHRLSAPCNMGQALEHPFELELRCDLTGVLARATNITDDNSHMGNRPTIENVGVHNV